MGAYQVPTHLTITNRLDRCGPHRLAKALEFCLGTPAHSPEGGSPSRAPSEMENSPQSLFQRSPDSYLPGMESTPQDGYFASTAQSLEAVVNGVSAHTTVSGVNVIEKKKPKLLLVEDNEINLRVNRRPPCIWCCL